MPPKTDVPPPTIWSAIRTGDVPLLEELLAFSPKNLVLRDEEGSTPLHSAAATGNESVVQVLLLKFAPVNCRGPKKVTPLHCAVKSGDLDVLGLLLSGGADLTLKATGIGTPLEFATTLGHTQIAAALDTFQHTGLPPVKDRYSRTGFGSRPWPELVVAAQRGDSELVIQLLEKGADIEYAPPTGGTALYWASLKGHLNVVRILLAHGAVRETDGPDQKETPIAAIQRRALVFEESLGPHLGPPQKPNLVFISWLKSGAGGVLSYKQVLHAGKWVEHHRLLPFEQRVAMPWGLTTRFYDLCARCDFVQFLYLAVDMWHLESATPPYSAVVNLRRTKFSFELQTLLELFVHFQGLHDDKIIEASAKLASGTMEERRKDLERVERTTLNELRLKAAVVGWPALEENDAVVDLQFDILWEEELSVSSALPEVPGFDAQKTGPNPDIRGGRHDLLLRYFAVSNLRFGLQPSEAEGPPPVFLKTKFILLSKFRSWWEEVIAVKIQSPHEGGRGLNGGYTTDLTTKVGIPFIRRYPQTPPDEKEMATAFWQLGVKYFEDGMGTKALQSPAVQEEQLREIDRARTAFKFAAALDPLNPVHWANIALSATPSSMEECLTAYNVASRLEGKTQQVRLALDVIRREKQRPCKPTDSEIDMPERLEVLATQFPYIKDKDVFQELYRAKLAKRLLMGTANEDHERAYLDVMRNIQGRGFTDKMERMLSDQERTNAINILFLVQHKEKIPCEFHCQVLGADYWPRYVPDNMRPIASLDTCMKAFTLFYKERFQSRRLNWLHRLGTTTMKIDFALGSKEVTAGTHQAHILMYIDEVGTMTGKALAENMGMEFDRAVKPYIGSMYLVKDFNMLCHGVGEDGKVLPANKEKLKDPNTTYQLNPSFTNKVENFKIGALAQGQGSDGNPGISEKIIEQHRSVVIDACVVNVVKARGVLEYAELLDVVFTKLSKTVRPKPKQIKLSVEKLIDREYLKRDPDQPDMLEYLA